jgi:hypothetical protein
MASAPHKHHKCDTDKQSETQEHHVDGYGVVVEGFVGRSVKSGLGEVEEAGETDDEAVDFAESGEAEDFGRVVAGSC